MQYIFVINARAKSRFSIIDHALRISNPSHNNCVIVDMSSFWQRIRFTRNIQLLEKDLLSKSTVKLIRPKLSIISNIEIWKTIIINYLEFRRNETWQTLEYRSINFGNLVRARACASLGSSLFLASELNFRSYLKYAYASVRSIELALNLLNTDTKCLVVFNGREPLESGYLKVAKMFGISTKIIEIGADNTKYEVYNLSPHLSAEWWEKIDEFKHNHHNLGFSESGLNYGIKKSSGFDLWENRNWMELMSDESDLNMISNYVLFFTSSTKEVSPFEDFTDDCDFQDQMEAVKVLSEACAELNYPLIIRRHPNSRGDDGKDRELFFWNKFKNISNVIYIPPENKINSYKLISKARIVFVWISTIGFDSLFRGKATFALGPARWAFNQELRCKNLEEIKKRIQTPGIPDLNSIICYSEYMANFGIKYTCIESVDKDFVHTKSKRIEVYRDIKFRIKISKILRRKQEK